MQFSPQGGIGGGFDGPGNGYSKSQFSPQGGIGGGFGGGPGNRNRDFTHPGHGGGPFKVLNAHYILVYSKFSNHAGRWHRKWLLFFEESMKKRWKAIWRWWRKFFTITKFFRGKKLSTEKLLTNNMILTCLKISPDN